MPYYLDKTSLRYLYDLFSYDQEIDDLLALQKSLLDFYQLDKRGDQETGTTNSPSTDESCLFKRSLRTLPTERLDTQDSQSSFRLAN